MINVTRKVAAVRGCWRERVLKTLFAQVENEDGGDSYFIRTGIRGIKYHSTLRVGWLNLSIHPHPACISSEVTAFNTKKRTCDYLNLG